MSISHSSSERKGHRCSSLQENHVKEASSPQRYTIHGYDMTDATYHAKYGTATYVREDLNASSVVVNSHQSTSYVSGITVVNIYKPPGVESPTPALPILPHPTVYTGDFNSHSTEWGYRVSDKAGDQLSQWSNDNIFHLLYDPKQKGNFPFSPLEERLLAIYFICHVR